MSRPLFSGRLSAIAFGCCLLGTGIPAWADTSSFIDLNADLGYSGNPFTQTDGESSAFGRLSAFGSRAWQSERGSTSLSAFVENTTYLKDYGSKQIFDLNAHVVRSMSPALTLSGDLGFSGDLGGQLSNRFNSFPTGPIDPIPPPVDNPDLIGLSGRQYRMSGNLGASIRSGARGTVSLSAGARRSTFTGLDSDSNYNTFLASAGYIHQLSDRTSIGGTLYANRQDYKGNNDTTVINPTVMLQWDVREGLAASASVGLLAIEQENLGNKDHSFSPSFSGSLCSSSELSRFCGRVSRDASSELGTQLIDGGREAAISTSGGLEYLTRLSPDQTVQASVSGVRYSAPDSSDGQKTHTTYLSGILKYDHKVGNRLSTGVSIGARRLYQLGPDPGTDFNGSIFLRYRIGDLL